MKKLLSYLFIGAVFYFLFNRVTSEWENIKTLTWNFSPMNLSLILLFSVCINIVNATTWHVISKSLGSNSSFRASIKVWIYSNMARFLPGGVWQYPTRVIMAKNTGVSSGISGSALLLETAFNVGVGLAIIFLFGRIFPVLSIPMILLIELLIIGGLFLFTSKKFTGQVLKLAKKILKKDIAEKPFSLQIKYIPLIILLVCLQFTLAGGILLTIAKSLVSLDLSALPEFISIYTSSWLLGYITIFAPAGLGVQELSISTLLVPFMAISLGTIIAIIFRLALLAGELVTLSIVYLLK